MTSHQPGIFTMSFDCEGLWGPSTLTPFLREHLTEDRLRSVYQQLVDLFERYDLKATFAFVGLFTLTRDEVLQHPHWFETASGQQWPRTQEFLNAVHAGHTSGWLSPSSFDIVQCRGRHELGTHGFQHLAIVDQQLTEQDFARELQLAVEAGQLRGHLPRTLIYPRNQVRFEEQLKPHGIVGYRDFIGMRRLPLPVSESVQLKWDALAALAREVDLWAKPHPAFNSPWSTGARGAIDGANAASDHPVIIPPGYFFNWRVGLRSRIPPRVTVARWSQLLHRATQSGGMVHLWAHPHNFITGRDQLECFEAVLKIAAEHVRRGSLLNLTQAEYCDACGSSEQPFVTTIPSIAVTEAFPTAL